MYDSTSTSAAVTVVPIPTITTQPVGSTICNGGTQNLSVVATNGTPSLNYQWQESDDNGVSDPWASAVGGSGSTTNAYTTPALAATSITECRSVQRVTDVRQQPAHQ